MDSLTQIALGAAVGEATLGRRCGNRALAWGAVLGTLPDLDVLVRYGDPVADFTFHRSFSHSLIMIALATPLIAWLIAHLHRDSEHLRGWMLMVWLTLTTHALLDSFTVYGTQILWPLTEWPATWSTVFIIDPLYTLPLVIGVIAALRINREGRVADAWRWNRWGLVVSSLYLGWTVLAKVHVETVVERELAEQGLDGAAVLTTPAPFNSLLWRIVVVTPDRYYEGFRSVLDGGAPLRLTEHPRGAELSAALQGHWPRDRLVWFTKGFYRARVVDGRVVITDLRMGVEDRYVFSFAVAAIDEDGATTPLPAVQLQPRRDLSGIGALFRRILEPGAYPTP